MSMSHCGQLDLFISVVMLLLILTSFFFSEVSYTAITTSKCIQCIQRQRLSVMSKPWHVSGRVLGRVLSGTGRVRCLMFWPWNLANSSVLRADSIWGWIEKQQLACCTLLVSVQGGWGFGGGCSYLVLLCVGQNSTPFTTTTTTDKKEKKKTATQRPTAASPLCCHSYRVPLPGWEAHQSVWHRHRPQSLWVNNSMCSKWCVSKHLSFFLQSSNTCSSACWDRQCLYDSSLFVFITKHDKAASMLALVDFSYYKKTMIHLKSLQDI